MFKKLIQKYQQYKCKKRIDNEIKEIADFNGLSEEKLDSLLNSSFRNRYEEIIIITSKQIDKLVKEYTED